MGPSIKRIFQQHEAINHFVNELPKDPTNEPQTINYVRVCMLLGTKEKFVTRAMLEFLNNSYI